MCGDTFLQWYQRPDFVGLGGCSRHVGEACLTCGAWGPWGFDVGGMHFIFESARLAERSGGLSEFSW